MSRKRGLVFVGWVTLSLAVLACGTVVLAVLQGPPTLTIEQIQDEASYLDPKEGSVHQLGAIGGKPVIVAMLGDCMGCSMHKADFEELRTPGGYEVVGLHKPGAKLENVLGQHPWMNVVEDDTDLHAKLNTYFTPRVYAFDARGRLLAAQGPQEELSRFLVRLGTKL